MSARVPCRGALLCLAVCMVLSPGCASDRTRLQLPQPGALKPTPSDLRDAKQPKIDATAVVPASAELAVQETTAPPSPSDTSAPQAETVHADSRIPPDWLGPGPGDMPTPSGYLIQPGDVLAVKFRVTSDLNEEVVVRPDGMISLHLIGDVMAAYITPEELATGLEAAFKEMLRDPQLTVIVRTFAGNQVYVGGEVQNPGNLVLSGRLTTLQAIIQAGGFRDTADRHHIIIRRFGGGSEVVDLHAELHGRKFNQDIPLNPYDVVYVPKSRIAKANLFVDQYINKVIPFQRSFGFFLNYSTFSTAAAATTP